MSPRQRDPIEPNEGDKRYVRRDETGRFVDDRVVDPRDEGAVLHELYRRLVSIHHGLATAGPDDKDRDVYALERLDEALHFITEQPTYRAAREAERRAKAATAGHVVGGSSGGGTASGGTTGGSAGVTGGAVSGGGISSGRISGPETITDPATRGLGSED